MNTLQELQNEIAAWQARTFPGGTLHGQAAHLVKEAKELQAAPDDLEEYADNFILLLGMAKRCGFTAPILLEAVRLKMEMNKSRKWGAPDASGVCEHVEPTIIPDDKLLHPEDLLEGDLMDRLSSARRATA